MNRVDPTGHCYDTSDACLNRWTQYGLYAYGVKLKGNGWTLEYSKAAFEAVKDVGTMLSNYVGGASHEAFNKTYGGIAMEIGSCSECNGAGGYTHNSHWIEFDSESPFFKPTEHRTSELAFEMNVHEVVHELGHAFASIGSWYDKSGALHLRPNSPYASSFPSSWYLTNAGFAQGPDYTNPWMWRMHPDQGVGVEDDIIRAHEAFADMFLGFTYGKWAGDQWGIDRANYMTTNMAEWIP